MTRKWSARAGVLIAALTLAAGLGPAAWAAGGQSTPGVTVTAQNPGAAGTPSQLRLTLTAHSEASTVANPSCRPQDRNLACWGDLVLRVPEIGGLTLKGLEVHRIAVGDITCGGGEDEGDCGGEMTAATTPDNSPPVQAQVNGTSTITNPGDAICPVTGTICPAGTKVQVLMTLTDNGAAQYGDTITIDVNQFVPGPNKPTIWETSAPQTIQQVQIHYDNG
ncbi:MAG: hypothetical protein ACM3ML_18800 [Micromonosporaceae bacterium]